MRLRFIYIMFLSAIILLSCSKRVCNCTIGNGKVALDTLITTVFSSTGSGDLTILKKSSFGKIDANKVSLSAQNEIYICGKYSDYGFSNESLYQVIGYYCSIDTSNPIGNVPVFNIIKQKKIGTRNGTSTFYFE